MFVIYLKPVFRTIAIYNKFAIYLSILEVSNVRISMDPVTSADGSDVSHLEQNRRQHWVPNGIDSFWIHWSGFILRIMMASADRRSVLFIILMASIVFTTCLIYVRCLVTALRKMFDLLRHIFSGIFPIKHEKIYLSVLPASLLLQVHLISKYGRQLQVTDIYRFLFNILNISLHIIGSVLRLEMCNLWLFLVYG